MFWIDIKQHKDKRHNYSVTMSNNTIFNPLVANNENSTELELEKEIKLLHEIIYPRIPPYLWECVAYIGGLITIFYYNRTVVVSFAILFVFYGLANILFDYCCVTIETNNDIMSAKKDDSNSYGNSDDKLPNYKNFGNYSLYVTNKKYKVKNKQLINVKHCQTLLDNGNIQLELTVYLGDSVILQHLLFGIYLLGITKKNFTNSIKNKKAPLYAVY